MMVVQQTIWWRSWWRVVVLLVVKTCYPKIFFTSQAIWRC